MAGGQERILRTRIRSVESTKKITRAMELIAASRMARAQQRIAGSRPYLQGMERVLADVASDGTAPARLLGIPESPQNVAVVTIVSDRGLCGGYNAFVLRAAERLMTTGEAEGRSYKVTGVGKKAVPYFRFRGREVTHPFSMSDSPTYEDAREVAATFLPAFLAGAVDLVELVSTRFFSAGTQTVETRQVLPLQPPEPAGAPPTVSVAPAADDGQSLPMASGGGGGFFEFEPSAEDLLSLLVPRYAEAAVYSALLEASASEHVARQRAMSAASDNAEDIITNLRRVMNRARQDTITNEIMEIVGGAEALRQGSRTDVAAPLEYGAEEQSA
ncbi:MAG: ATP synthase F1 subunit gamma [Acidimicrobiales bacterium]